MEIAPEILSNVPFNKKNFRKAFYTDPIKSGIVVFFDWEEDKLEHVYREMINADVEVTKEDLIRDGDRLVISVNPETAEFQNLLTLCTLDEVHNWTVEISEAKSKAFNDTLSQMAINGEIATVKMDAAEKSKIIFKNVVNSIYPSHRPEDYDDTLFNVKLKMFEDERFTMTATAEQKEQIRLEQDMFRLISLFLDIRRSLDVNAGEPPTSEQA